MDNRAKKIVWMGKALYIIKKKKKTWKWKIVKAWTTNKKQKQKKHRQEKLFKKENYILEVKYR